MAETPSPAPKLFISYSWSSPEHEAWVLSLARELASQGINVILDKWDLKPGHDANAFMESMVSDPEVTKVVLVCDRKYAEKSNSRSGGAGTEAQIITPELYAKKAQDKFVAVVRERDRDGQAYLPIYYKGRIYIDLTDSPSYATEFEKLVRWAWDKPLHVRPELGTRPAYLSNDASHIKIATSFQFQRAFDAIKSGRDNAVPATVEYFDTLACELDKFRIAYNGPEFDEIVVKSITDFLPYRNELIKVFAAIAAYRCSNEMLEALHRLFEKLMPFSHRPEHVMSWIEESSDNFRFITHELFLYCIGILMKYERFDAAAFLIDNEYYFENPSSYEVMHSYREFWEYLKTLEYRNQRLNLRQFSLRADMLKERNKGAGVDLKYLMAADFVLYLRSQTGDLRFKWWPETLVYGIGRSFTIEMFARAKSQRYFDRIKGLLHVADKAELERMLDKIEAEPGRIPQWGFGGLNPRELVQFDSIGTVP